MKAAFANRLLVGAFASVALCQGLAQSSPCLPQPKLTVTQTAGTDLWLDLAGSPGINYALEISTDLAQWLPLATNRSSSGTVRFSQPASGRARFFRAVTARSADGLGGAFIFDGQTFAGWEGDTTNVFRISECAIIGGSLEQSFAERHYLCTTRSYTNFIIRLEWKLVGANANSGVQFRSERVPDSEEVSGYQADLGDGYWGSLYDEARRGLLVNADQTAVLAVLKSNDWNAYVIQAEGPRIRQWVNDRLTVDFTETNLAIPRSGIIGFQVHSGGRFEASFRNISLEVLP